MKIDLIDVAGSLIIYLSILLVCSLMFSFPITITISLVTGIIICSITVSVGLRYKPQNKIE